MCAFASRASFPAKVRLVFATNLAQPPLPVRRSARDAAIEQQKRQDHGEAEGHENRRQRVRPPPLQGLDQTEVWFNPMTESQILDYIRRENVFDKAGAYAIQGFASVYISRIAGNYFNVMGLPLPLVYNLLCRTLS